MIAKVAKLVIFVLLVSVCASSAHAAAKAAKQVVCVNSAGVIAVRQKCKRSESKFQQSSYKSGSDANAAAIALIPNPATVLEVATSGAPYTSVAAAVAAAAASASATTPILVKIAPGTYDLGSTTLVVAPHVVLAGSGKTATILRTTSDFGIELQSNTTLRDLQISSSAAITVSLIYANDKSNVNLEDYMSATLELTPCQWA